MHVCVCVYVYMYMYIYNYVQRQEHICGRALYKSVVIIIIIIIYRLVGGWGPRLRVTDPLSSMRPNSKVMKTQW